MASPASKVSASGLQCYVLLYFTHSFIERWARKFGPESFVEEAVCTSTLHILQMFCHRCLHRHWL